MCGIFGVAVPEGSGWTALDLERAVSELFRLSESRGKEAAGLALQSRDRIHVLKAPFRASRLLAARPYRALWREALGEGPLSSPVAVVGHARLVTDGASESSENNHPVVKDGVVLVHNGIVVNHEDLWRRHPSLTRRFDVDTEVLASLLGLFLAEGLSPPAAAGRVFPEVEGTASIAAFFTGADGLLLATNNGSLHRARAFGRAVVFASERPILEGLSRLRPFRRGSCLEELRQLPPGTGCWIDPLSCEVREFRLGDTQGDPPRAARREVRLVAVGGRARVPAAVRCAPAAAPAWRDAGSTGQVYCARCVLPETYPFVDFDREGVCRYCRDYRPYVPEGVEELHRLADRVRSRDGRADSIVAISGGRDSSYMLHHVKKVLGLHPIAYTYDWGMVTDLARRNIARLCGKLGVEHVLVSADIPAKRENIRKNVLAWLRSPDLGLVPLFMAGDKMLWYHANRLRKEYGVGTVFFGINELENEDFKVGFSGIPTEKQPVHRFFGLPLFKAARLAAYYARGFLANPTYLNASLPDTAFAFWCYFLMSHDYYRNFFAYVRWDEEEITRTLREEYRWEFASDTTTSWRIGDGTAALYNYIYWTVAGVTEHHALRSNQVREGMLGRERALALVESEARPRYESIREYCDLIGVDVRRLVQVVESIPKRRPERAGRS
ncbi:MAG: hypothetical protein HY720_17545 [Planctomycetes bacterium]|nr:hypothetical protein [Planctomycetota bacterium]